MNHKSGSLLFEPQKLITSDLTSEGLREIFECDSADTCAGKFPLVSMGGRAEGLACADPGARTPIGASGISISRSPSALRAVVLENMIYHYIQSICTKG